MGIYSVFALSFCALFTILRRSTVNAGSDPNGQLTPEDHERSRVSYPPPVPDNQLPVAPPSTRSREYNWKLSGSTACSASCGRGAHLHCAIFHLVKLKLTARPKMCSPSGHPEMWVSLFLHQVCRNVSQQWMLCSEWVPSE